MGPAKEIDVGGEAHVDRRYSIHFYSIFSSLICSRKANDERLKWVHVRCARADCTDWKEVYKKLGLSCHPVWMDSKYFKDLPNLYIEKQSQNEDYCVQLSTKNDLNFWSKYFNIYLMEKLG